MTVACHRDTGEDYWLADTADEEFIFPRPGLTIAKQTVAYALDFSPDPNEPGRETHVFDERFFPHHGDLGGWVQVQDQLAGKGEQARLGSVVVRGNGAVAWIACPLGRGLEGTLCTRPGHLAHVFRVRAGSHLRQTIAEGRNIDPLSLHLKGVRMVWKQGGRSRSARL